MAIPQKNEERLMTGEELARRPDLNPCELVNGRVVPMAPAGRIHGAAESRLDVELALYARRTGSGRVMVGEVGIYTRRDPDKPRFVAGAIGPRTGLGGIETFGPEGLSRSPGVETGGIVTNPFDVEHRSCLPVWMSGMLAGESSVCIRWPARTVQRRPSAGLGFGFPGGIVSGGIGAVGTIAPAVPDDRRSRPGLTLTASRGGQRRPPPPSRGGVRFR